MDKSKKTRIKKTLTLEGRRGGTICIINEFKLINTESIIDHYITWEMQNTELLDEAKENKNN